MITQYLKKQVHKVYGLNLGQRNAVDSCQYMKWKVCLTSYQQQRFYKDGFKSRKKVTSFAAKFQQLCTTTTSSNNPKEAWCLFYVPTSWTYQYMILLMVFIPMVQREQVVFYIAIYLLNVIFQLFSEIERKLLVVYVIFF